MYIFITEGKLFYTTSKCSRCKVKDPLSPCKPLLTFGCRLLDLTSHTGEGHVIILQSPHLLDWEKLISRPTLSPVLSLVSLMGVRLAKKPLKPGCFTRAPVPFCWCWFWGEEVRTAPSSALLSPVRPWQGPGLCSSTSTDSELSPCGWMDLPPDCCSSPYTLPLDSPF